MFEENKIYHGDCLNLMKKINSNSIDFLFTDLPYGTTNADFDKPIDLNLFWEQVNRITKSNACVALWTQQPYTTDVINSNWKNFKYEWVIEKGRATGHYNANKQPLKAHETVLIFYRKPPTYNPQKTTGHPRKISLAKHKEKCKESPNYNKNSKLTSYDSTERYPRTVLKFKWPSQKKSLHPQQKSLEACEYFIKTYTNENDLVCDCTTGVGTICKAAKNLNRRFIGIEKNFEFFTKANKNIWKTKNQTTYIERKHSWKLYLTS